MSGSSAFAQVTGSITGRVEDVSGAAVPAANVTVTSLETGATRIAAADESGNYRLLSLPVGRYDVKAEKVGFKAAVEKGINLVVGQQEVLNLKLDVGDVQQEVTVTGAAPLVNTTTDSVAGLVGEKQVKELPLNGRSFDLLLTLNAGTINFTSSKSTPGVLGGNIFSVDGRRPGENLTLLNGIEYTGAGNTADTPGGASGQLLGIDAVREFNVVTDNYGVEYGKKAGAQVNVVTQSGTNQLHGTLFEFLRNSELDARNFFDHSTIPPFKRNQFGGAAGGPIRKDKTFIFGNYEGFRQRLGISDLTFVPDVNARNGFLPCGASGFPTCAPGAAVGTATLVPNLEPRILPYLNDFWPVPNGPVLGQGVAEAFSNPAQSIREDFGTIRIDQMVSGKDTLSGIYTISDGYNQTPLADPFFASATDLRNQILSVQETHIFSPQVVNSFTAGFSRTNSTTLSPPLVNIPANLYFVPGNVSPGGLGIGSVGGQNSQGISQSGAISGSAIFVRNLFTFSDGVQVVHGKHQFSFGGWLQRAQNNDYDPLIGSGQATFASITTMLQGVASTFQIAPNTIPQAWRLWEGAWYVQDSIQLRPNLTVRIGLRHEFTGNFTEATGRAQTELFDPSGVIQTLPRVSGTFNTANNAKLLLSPRVGLAWDPFGKGKTSIRAAFGTYYDLVDWLAFIVDVTPPLAGAAALSNVPLFSVVPLSASLALPPACGPNSPALPNCIAFSPRSFESNYKTPTVESWDFAIEQQLNQNTALRVAYVGSEGFHQLTVVDPNAIPAQICSNAAGCVSGGINAASARGTVPQGAQYIPIEATRPNPYLTYGIFWSNQNNSNYNGLQVELTRRFAQGLQFRANYTWSKSLDFQSHTAGNSGGANEVLDLLDPNDPGRDRGPSAFNAGQQFRANLTYELPFGRGKPWLNGVHGVSDKLISGWQVNTIVSLVSGFPLVPVIGSNRSGDGDLNNPDRPNYLVGYTGNPIQGVTAGCGGGVIPSGQQLGTATRWFDPCAFTLPTGGTFGNVGRAALVGPGLADVDLSIFKNTHITERAALQFRAEFFNILNHTNFGNINEIAFAGTTYSPSAGVVTSTATSSRQIQFGLKLTF